MLEGSAAMSAHGSSAKVLHCTKQSTLQVEHSDTTSSDDMHLQRVMYQAEAYHTVCSCAVMCRLVSVDHSL